MLKAKHTLLSETTNNELTLIRYKELFVLVNFFNQIGLQSSLIAAFELKIFAQVGQHKLDPVGEDWTELTITYLCIYVYWIATAIGVNFAICSMAMSLFLAVWGQRLAINGPIGSIIRSINLMKPYQITVLKVFTANVFFLSLSTAFQPFVYQNLQPAFLSCFLTLAGFYTIAHYCLDIYDLCYFPNLFHNFSDIDEEGFKKSGRTEVDAFDSVEENRNVGFIDGEDSLHSAENSVGLGTQTTVTRQESEDNFRETFNIGGDGTDVDDTYEKSINTRFLHGMFSNTRTGTSADAVQSHNDL